MPQTAHVGMYSSRHFHKNYVKDNAYITVGDPCTYTAHKAPAAAAHILYEYW